jgi:hypothetical protein
MCCIYVYSFYAYSFNEINVVLVTHTEGEASPLYNNWYKRLLGGIWTVTFNKLKILSSTLKIWCKNRKSILIFCLLKNTTAALKPTCFLSVNFMQNTNSNMLPPPPSSPHTHRTFHAQQCIYVRHGKISSRLHSDITQNYVGLNN